MACEFGTLLPYRIDDPGGVIELSAQRVEDDPLRCRRRRGGTGSRGCA
ncbi:hypothetical protein [Mycolicibacterium stellerae]|nr:hypothetical protein [Mycolicibacterium stellerae]